MKFALLTGANSGLGLELYKLLKEEGYTLLVTGRKALPEAFEAVQADLIHERSKVIAMIRKYAPELVINNAGYGTYGYATDHSLDILQLNAVAAIDLTIEAARILKEKGKKGIILNVSSIAGEGPMPFLALYGAAKACLTSFSRSFDEEMRPFGIRILATLPGQIDTPFADNASNHFYQQIGGMKKEYVAKRIMKQIRQKKQIEIVDWTYKLAVFWAKLFPSWAARVVAHSLKGRFSK
jgi:hypothetical protein